MARTYNNFCTEKKTVGSSLSFLSHRIDATVNIACILQKI